MSSRAETIARILENRKPMAEKAAETDNLLHQIEEEVRKFRGFAQVYAKDVKEDVAEKVRALEPDLDSILEKIGEQKGGILQLNKRFSRPTLNIGVVGRPKQGKSTLLKALSGLSDSVIPTGSDYCTGAASSLSNTAGLKSGEAVAEIDFHTERSFLRDVLSPYWKLHLDLGVPEPRDLSDFRSMDLPTEPGPKCEERQVGQKFVDELRGIQENLPNFEADLGNRPEKGVTGDRIREFVAQTDSDRPDANKIYRWRAVKKANIECSFPIKDVGKISFVDTPGLGQIAVGLEDYVKDTMGGDIDFALFIRRGETGDQTIDLDIRLYDLVANSIREIPLHKWSTYIINRSADLEGQLAVLRRNMNEAKIGFDGGIREFDARSEDEARKEFDSLLDFLTGRIPELDKALFSQRTEALKDLAADIAELAERAKDALPTAGLVQPNAALLDTLFDETWKKIASGLIAVTKEYWEQRNDPDEDFLADLEAIFTELSKGPKLPSLEEIEREVATHGKQTWHGHKLNSLRVDLAGAFEQIDVSFERSYEVLREKLISEFKDETGGNLSFINDEEAKWEKLIERWAEQVGGSDVIHAIQLLCSASLSFRTLIQPRIRQCLDVLDSDSSESEDYMYFPGDEVSVIVEKLSLAWQDACYHCKAEIENMAREPSMARFATAEDFREAILHTGGENSKQRWRRFYEYNCADVWPEEFEQLEGETRKRKEWENAVKNLNALANRLS